MMQVTYKRVDFTDLPGWQCDDHADALSAFILSCRVLLSSPGPFDRLALANAMEAALGTPSPPDRGEARAFFEKHFVPHRVSSDPAVHQPSLLTGYFEPELAASFTRTERFHVPLYGRPPDLVDCLPDSARGTRNGQMTHGKQTANGIVPHATRAEIDDGALDAGCPVVCYLDDEVDAFILHVQGSGLLKFEDGSQVRVGYAGKNGHPYVSIGKILIGEGHFRDGELSLARLVEWLKADRRRARAYIQRNPSFIFFKTLVDERGGPASAANGVNNIPLSAGRSLAVDPEFHPIGTPIFLDAPDLTNAFPNHLGKPFRRLMIAQDVGSAIRGPERGDIFFGTGAKAGELAGGTKHAGTFYALLPARPAGVRSA